MSNLFYHYLFDMSIKKYEENKKNFKKPIYKVRKLYYNLIVVEGQQPLFNNYLSNY